MAKLYANYISQQDNGPYEDALCKALFIISNFGADTVIDVMLNEHQSEAEEKSEEALRSAAFFKNEVEEIANSLRPLDVFAPLYIGIKKKNYEKGDRLYQRSRNPPYSGMYGYKRFLEDAALIYKLEQLGIFKKDTEYGSTGKYIYIFTEADTIVLRRIIFGTIEESLLYTNQDIELKYLNDDLDKILPFQRCIGG